MGVAMATCMTGGMGRMGDGDPRDGGQESFPWVGFLGFLSESPDRGDFGLSLSVAEFL